MPLQLLFHKEAKEKMVTTVQGWVQIWLHAVIQRACYPKFSVKMNGWEFTVLTPALHEFTELVGGRQDARDRQTINHKPIITCYKKGNHMNAQIKVQHERVLQLCLALVRPHMKY